MSDLKEAHWICFNPRRQGEVFKRVSEMISELGSNFSITIRNTEYENKIALLERKLELVLKQRDKALYYVDHDNIALDFEAKFKKELEELK